MARYKPVEDFVLQAEINVAASSDNTILLLCVASSGIIRASLVERRSVVGGVWSHVSLSAVFSAIIVRSSRSASMSRLWSCCFLSMKNSSHTSLQTGGRRRWTFSSFADDAKMINKAIVET